MHQIAQIWTYIFTNFPGVIPPDPKTGEGVRPLPLGARVHRPIYLDLPWPLPPIRTPNMQRDFTNRSYSFL